MAEYRWNQTSLAEEFDRAAEYIHRHYLAVQDAILTYLVEAGATEGLIVDAGGGSGRLAERILERFPATSMLVVDQSTAFLEIAERRMARFGARGAVRECRLQDDWPTSLTQSPAAIVSMSAIHHLEPSEKQALYSQCYSALTHGGVLLNGDEVRDPNTAVYKQQMLNWSDWKNAQIAAGRISDAMAENWRRWEERNLVHFDAPRKSGDDCHETIDAQLGYFRAAGFRQVDSPWRIDMWAVLRGVKK